MLPHGKLILSELLVGLEVVYGLWICFVALCRALRIVPMENPFRDKVCVCERETEQVCTCRLFKLKLNLSLTSALIDSCDYRETESQ